jgi:tetratricopeptide (TPR) repeat protein
MVAARRRSCEHRRVPPQNPIEARLPLLYEQWESFVGDPEARVLRWLLRDDERRMLEAFLALEESEHGELPAWFMSFDTPVDNRYGHELRRELDRRLRAMDQEFAELGLAPWAGAASEATVSDIGLLMQTCAALLRHVGEHVETLVVLLWPRAVREPAQFVEWLRRAARVIPPRVRFVVVDRAEAPLLDELDSERVRSVSANLDMPGALEQLAAAAPGRDSPGGRLREAFVAMSTALSRGDLEQARTHAEAATTIARAAGFDELEAAVAFALGGGLLGAGEGEHAAEQFRRAEQLAARAPESDWGPSLRVKAQLGLAGAAFGEQAWSRAAHEYSTAGAWAGEQGDRSTQADALRMAAWSFEQAGDLEHAWATGLIALEVAEQMNEEALEHSTVPWLGELLLRLSADGSAFAGQRVGVSRRLARLLGGGWRERE